MSAWVRNGVLMGADELAVELGGDPVALRREVGLDGSPLPDPDFPIPATAVVHFLERAAAVCACEAFGLLLSQKQDFSIFGPLWPLFRSASSVDEMLRDLAEFFPVHTQGALPTIEHTPDGAVLSYDLAAGVAQSRRQVIELGFGFVTTQLRRLRPNWRPAEVSFRHSPPAELKWHRRLLGQNLQFNADRNAILIDREMLAQPFGSDDANERSGLALKFGTARATIPGAVCTHAEIVVRGLLPFARCDLVAAARMMRMSPRTLQRRLGAEHTSFDQIVDKVRADMAVSYLRDSDLAVAAVAEILQFSETSALTRACRRWYGLAPMQVRRPRHEAAGGTP
jgi:AraC-like DNA-binding protein